MTNLSKQAKETSGSGSYRIFDFTGTMGHLGLAALVLFFSYAMMHDKSISNRHFGLFAALPIGVILVFRTFTYSLGYVIDLEKGTISFPGGGISPTSLRQVLSLSFLLQYIGRFQVDFRDIRSAQRGSITKFDKDGKAYYIHWILISGNFGAARLNVGSKTKRDQIFASIASANNMGIPVVVRQ